MIRYAEALRSLGVPHATFKSWINKGVIPYLRDEKNCCVWSPEMLKEIKGRITTRTQVLLGPAPPRPKKPEKPPVPATTNA
jgi:predicted site-specific integrase-resolvase